MKGISRGWLTEGRSLADFSEAQVRLSSWSIVCVYVSIGFYTLIAIQWGAVESSLTTGAVPKDYHGH